jgi:hypothetical protein
MSRTRSSRSPLQSLRSLPFARLRGAAGLVARATKAALIVAFRGTGLRDRRDPRATMRSRSRSPARSWQRSLVRAGLACFAFLVPVAIAWWVCPGSPLSGLPFGASFSNHVVAEPTSSVPTDVMFYGHVLYGGDDAYLVEGKWYRPGAQGWQVFASEPPELAMLRRSLEGDRRALGWLHL